MKKIIKTYILGAVLIVSILILSVPKFTNHIKVENNKPQKVFNFDVSDIDKIEIVYVNPINLESDQRQEVVLEKTENGWVDSTNNNYKVKAGDVEELLEQASGITQGDLTSNNPERQEQLEIDSTKGVHVKIWNSEDLVSNFWLGKNGADGNSTYFRLDESDFVYSTKNSIRFYFTKPEWIDKTIWKIDQSKINKITLNIDWQKIVLEKKKIEVVEDSIDEVVAKDIWEVVSPQKFEVDEQIMSGLLGSLSNLSAFEVVFDKKAEDIGLINSKLKVLVYLDNNDSPRELFIGKKLEQESDDNAGATPDTYYVKIDNSDQIFTIHSYFVDNFFNPKLEDLKVKSE